jgi:hypothetical protein
MEMACSLIHVPTEQLMHEIVQRTIAGDDVTSAPHSLLQLICAITTVLDTQQRFAILNSLRDAADLLENECV